MRKRPLRSPRKILDGFDGQRQHRTLHELASLASEHRLGFGVLLKQATIDPRRQIIAARCHQLKTVLD
jgi:hypothetical protein